MTADESPGPTGWRRMVARGREEVEATQAKATELLDKYGDRPALAVGIRLWERDRNMAGTVLGSAIAFRLFLFFVPFLLFLAGALGFLARWIDQDQVEQEAGITGTVAEQISVALSQPDTSRWIATLVGLIGMATTGRALSKVMVSATCLAWQLPVRSKASPRVIGGIIGLVSGIGLVSVVINRVRGDLGIAAAGISFFAAFVIYGVAWIAMSMLLPRATRDPGALLPGAVLVGATIAVMQAISQLYLPSRLGRASALYGAIGTTVVTLGWFFFLGRAIVVAMAVDAIIYERFGSVSQFVFGLPVVRILPRRSAALRRFFDLDDPEANRAAVGEPGTP